MSAQPAPLLVDAQGRPLRPRTGAGRPLRSLAASYTGADTSRRQTRNWDPGLGSANTDTLFDLPQLRARSRDLERNSPMAGGAINTNVTEVVGTGLSVHPRLDRELLGLTDEEADAWERQAKRLFAVAECELDLTRMQDFAGMQALTFRSVLASGDILAVRRFRRRKGELFGTKVQLVEADRITNPNQAPDTERLIAGVEIDEDGAPLAYQVADIHPGELVFSRPTRWARVTAFGAVSGERQALHLYHRRRPGQVRGVPYLAPVIEPLRQLDRYTEGELQAAVVSSFFTVFIKSLGDDTASGIAPLDGETLPDNPKAELNLGPGVVLDLDPGEEPQFADPGRPNQAFDGFVLAVLRQVGVALELPYEVLVKHFTASYSAARAALLQAWKFFRSQREWLAYAFCQPVYEWVMAEAVSRGMIEAPGFFDNPILRRAWLSAEWTGPAPGQIDPLKEGQANKLYVDMAVKTLEQVTAETTGGNWEENFAQRVKERRMITAAGLDFEDIAERVQTESVQGQPDPGSDGSDLEDETQTGGAP